MRSLITVATLITLSGCSEGGGELASNPSDVDHQAAELIPVEITPGLYAVGDETTEYGRTRLNADGTYIDLDGDTPVAEGIWRADGEMMCFDPQGEAEHQQERCWINEAADADGSFISNRDDGSQSYRVTPLAE